MESLERLIKLDKIELKNYISYTLNNLDLEGEYVLIIPKNYSSYDFEDLINFSSYKFTIMEFIREEIEFEVSKILFDWGGILWINTRI